MTIADVQARAEEIRSLDDSDSEVLIAAERILIADVLRDIAEGTCDNPRACAKIALRSAGYRVD